MRHVAGKSITLILTAVLTTPVFAQTASDLHGEALLQAILAEMRLLRTTLQKNAAFELRARVLLERARIQQEIVRELQREVENRNLEAEFRTEVEPFDQMVTDLEERLRKETDPTARRSIEQELLGLRRRKDINRRHRELMELRFHRKEERLAEETARLRAIEDELQRLERTVASSPE